MPCEPRDRRVEDMLRKPPRLLVMGFRVTRTHVGAPPRRHTSPGVCRAGDRDEVWAQTEQRRFGLDRAGREEHRLATVVGLPTLAQVTQPIRHALDADELDEVESCGVDLA